MQVTVGEPVGEINADLSPAAGISGAVTTASGGSDVPVSMAQLEVFPVGATSAVAAGSTATDGTYLVPGLPAGTYDVCFVTDSFSQPAGSYVDQCYNQVPWSGSAPLPTGASAVTAAAGAVTTSIDAELALPAG